MKGMQRCGRRLQEIFLKEFPLREGFSLRDLLQEKTSLAGEKPAISQAV